MDLSIHQGILKKMYSTVLNIDDNNNNKLEQPNQHIRMISEGSCETEDWRNDAENLALITGINYIIKYIQIESSFLK